MVQLLIRAQSLISPTPEKILDVKSNTAAAIVIVMSQNYIIYYGSSVFRNHGNLGFSGQKKIT